MSRLPEYLDPWRAAERGQRLSGELAVSDLPRVAALVTGSSGEVRFALEFYRDGSGRACANGRVTARVELQCQRCLGPLAISVDSPILLCAVLGLDEAALLPEQYDPLVVDEEGVSPLGLIEDEILLALPQVPLHPEGSCRAQVPQSGAGEDAAAEAPANPFAVLARLKN